MYYLGWGNLNLEVLSLSIIIRIFELLGNLLNSTKITCYLGDIFNRISNYLLDLKPLSITRPSLVHNISTFKYNISELYSDRWLTTRLCYMADIRKSNQF